MSADVCVLWRDHAPGPVLEGGRARRFHLVRALGERGEVHRLPLPQGQDGAARSRAYCETLLRALWAAARTPAPRVLLFYPDLPGFLPARAWKLPVVLAWLLALKLVLVLRGRRLVVDVVDVPRWQARSLNYALPVGEPVWWVLERALFGLADRVCVTNAVVAGWLARSLGLPRGRFFVLTNAAPRAVLSLVRRPAPRARFVYLGNLESSQDRGIRRLCRAFTAHAHGDVELVLIGEGGDWIAREFPHPRLRVLPVLPEDECLPWLASADFALIPYPTDGYYPAVCPMKLPLYALARVPIISTDSETNRGLIERHALGECLTPEEAFARWEELARKYRGFRGGRGLEQLAWETVVEGLMA